MNALFPRVIVAFLSLVAGVVAAFAQAPSADAAGSPAKERIGVYDSRAVAVAFAGSPAQEAQLRRLRERRDAASAAGDAAESAKVKAEGQAMQRKAHQQAFGTAPVDEILAELGDVLPELRKNAGVSALVSKWDERELARHPGADRVDVTPRLIDALHPTERQRRSAIEIQKHAPISLERAAELKD